MAGYDFSIKLKTEPAFAYGEKLYRVTTDRTKYIKEACPVCNDAGRVEIKGYDCKCPLCNDSSKNGTGINIRHYTVVEYIINDIHIVGPEVKKAYDGNGTELEAYLPTASYCGFAKASNSLHAVVKQQFGSYDLLERAEEFALDGKCVAKSKKVAEAACLSANNKEKEALEAFNQKFGTKHQWPWGND